MQYYTSSQCNGSVVSIFPAGVNGVTVTQTYTGDVVYGISYTICSVGAGPTFLGPNASSFIQKLSFSVPVNNILYILNASDSCGSNIESFSFSVDNGTLMATQAGTSCPYNQIGNTFVANTYGPPGNAAYITLSSSQPYNTITISGPGGCNGSYMALCSSSIGIESYSVKGQLSIYPNPSIDGKFFADYSLPEDAILYMTDFAGIELKKYQFSSAIKKQEINLTDLAPGVYFYKVCGRNSILKSGKIVILN